MIYNMLSITRLLSVTNQHLFILLGANTGQEVGASRYMYKKSQWSTTYL